MTPTARQAENDPLISIGGLARTMRETAQSLGVVCIDLNQMVIDLKAALGSNAKYIYMHTANDQTHFCEYGAYELARCVMKGLEEQLPSLKSTFKEGYSTFSPSAPDPLDILEKELPPVRNRKKTLSGRENARKRFFVSETGIHVAGRQSSLLKLKVYGIDGKEVGIEFLTVPEAGGTVSSELLGRLARGTYILSLESEGAAPEMIMHSRI